MTQEEYHKMKPIPVKTSTPNRGQGITLKMSQETLRADKPSGKFQFHNPGTDNIPRFKFHEPNPIKG